MRTPIHPALRRLSAYGAATLLTLACSAAGAQAMRAADITDAAGFGQPLPAAIAQIPADWQTRGGVNWDRSTNCIANQLRIEWSAVSPDGQQAFEIMRGFSWQLQGTQIQMNPCPAQPFDSARAFLAAVVQQRRPGARILDYRTRPDIAEAAARSMRPDPRVRARQDAGDLLIGYQSQGVDVRERLSTTVSFTEVQGNVVGGTGMVFAQRAPNRQLDFAFGDELIAAIKVNPHWLALMKESTGAAEQRFSAGQSAAIARWHAAEMANINAKGEADRSAIRTKSQREIGQIYSEINANTQRTNDDMHRRNLEAIGEHNTHSGSNGQPVRSSIHGGQRVLQMPNGSTFSTDDPNLNPPGSRELQRIR